MAVHSYWRINVTANDGDANFLAAAEIEMRATVGGADQCTGGTASASNADGASLPAAAFDNSASTRWSTVSGTVVAWIAYQFASPVDVAQYTIQAHPSSPARSPKNWTLEYSDNGTVWTVRETRINETGWTNNQIRSYTPPSAFLVDSSSYARSLTAQNGARMAASTKFGNGALQCTGTGGTSTTGYGVTAPSSTDFNFAGQFTLEGWFYFNTAQTESALISRWGTGGSQQALFITSSALVMRAGAFADVTASWTPVPGQWYHIAADRDASGFVRTYVDGVVKASGSRPGAMGAATSVLAIGYVDSFASVLQLDGYVDEVRISNVARYGAAFTPPITSFGSDANTLLLAHFNQDGGNTPAEANTKLLLHFDGTNGQTTTADSSASPKAISRSGTATLSTAQKKFGDSSGTFNQTDGWSIVSTPDFIFAGPFSVEIFVYLTSKGTVSNYALIANNAWQMGLHPVSNYLNFQWDTGSGWNELSSTWTPSTGVWYHVAVDRDASNTIRLYIDGAVVASVVGAGTISPTSGTFMGPTSSNGGVGYLDELRIVKDEVVYGGAFLPPTAPFVGLSVTPIRVSQTAVEVVRLLSNVSARISQTVVEVVNVPNPSLQVSQLATEVLRTTTVADVQLSQLATEVLRTTTVADVQLSQLLVEVLRPNDGVPGSHRHWRVDLARDTNSGFEIAEIEMRSSVGGADECSGGSVTVSSAWLTNGYEAFDNSTATAWTSGLSVTTGWIAYRFSAPVTIVELACVFNNVSRWPKTIGLSYSDDGTSWTVAMVPKLTDDLVSGGYTITYRLYGANVKSYWRLNIAATTGGGTYLAELEFRGSLGGPDLTVAGINTVVSTYGLGGQPGQYAFDNNAATHFADTDPTSWVGYRFVQDTHVVQYMLQAASGGGSNAPTTWTLEYSGDGVNWVVADTRSGQPPWSSNEIRVFPGLPAVPSDTQVLSYVINC